MVFQPQQGPFCHSGVFAQSVLERRFWVSHSLDEAEVLGLNFDVSCFGELCETELDVVAILRSDVSHDPFGAVPGVYHSRGVKSAQQQEHPGHRFNKSDQAPDLHECFVWRTELKHADVGFSLAPLHGKHERASGHAVVQHGQHCRVENHFVRVFHVRASKDITGIDTQSTAESNKARKAIQ